MSLFPLSGSTIKGRVLASFPVSVTGEGGIGVSKSGGVWTIEPAFDELDLIVPSSATNPSTRQIWIYDPVANVYNVMTLAGLGEALYVATSTTSLEIGTGSKAFTTQAGKGFAVGSFVIALSDADPTDYMLGQVTSYSGTSLTISVASSGVGGSGTLADWTIRAASPAGAQGAPGAPGASGSDGTSAGIKQTYDNSTTDADPGDGEFRLNNATPASATEGYFDNLDSGGATVSGIIDLWDDSTTTTKGHLRIEKSTDPAVWAEFRVTGSVVDGTGYRKLTLGNGAGSGAFTNGDTFAITFFRSGDKGADGAGAGDVTAASTFGTDNVIVRSDGTDKGVQSTGVSVDDSNNVSGVAALSVTSIELGHASANTLTASSGTLSVEGVAVLTTGTGLAQGKHSIEVPAGAMKPSLTSGAAGTTLESSTNDIAYPVFDFDASADEYAQFNFTFPKSWDEGTITFQATWTTTASDSDGVAWALQAVAVGDGDTIDASWGTAVVVTDDAQSAAGDILVTAESGAVTIGGTPAVGKRVFFRVFRDVSDANDDMTEDARLIGVTIFYTVNASTDA